MAHVADADIEAGAAIHPPKLTNTYWGYRIEEGEDAAIGSTAEPIMRLLGLILVLAAYAQWMLPGHLFPGDPFFTKATLTVIFAASGVAIYWFASRGRRRIVEVDLSRRQLRVAGLTSRGEVRLRGVYPMERVESAFIRRSTEVGRPSELHLRIAGGRAPVLVATGDEADLMTLHRRLSADLRPIRARVDEKLAQGVSFRTVRTA